MNAKHPDLSKPILPLLFGASCGFFEGGGGRGSRQRSNFKSSSGLHCLRHWERSQSLGRTWVQQQRSITHVPAGLGDSDTNVGADELVLVGGLPDGIVEPALRLPRRQD
jgi:hypothetical protein